MKRAGGLTLVEAMVTLAVIGIVLAVAVPSLSDMINRRRTLAVAEQLMTDIAFARAETGLRGQGLGITFNQDGKQTCYSIIYFRAAGSCNCTSGQGRACVFFNVALPDMEVRTVSFPIGLGVTVMPDPAWTPGVPDKVLRFEPPQLTALPAEAALHIQGSSGVHLRVQINQMGRVSLCSKGQAIGGVAPCSP